MKSRSTVDRCDSYYVITIIDISVIKATRRVEGIIGTITRRVFAMSWREATLKTSGATTRQVKRSGVAYEGLAFSDLKRNPLDHRSNVSLTSRQGRRKRKISLLNSKIKQTEKNKCTPRDYERRGEGKKKENWTVVYAIGRPFCLAVLHTVHAHRGLVSLRGLTRGWLSCLAMPEYPGRLGAAGNCIAVPPPYARQRAAPRRSLHRRKETERGRPSRFIEFSNFGGGSPLPGFLAVHPLIDN